jgi:hypothetical protein
MDFYLWIYSRINNKTEFYGTWNCRLDYQLDKNFSSAPGQ